jgi:hypothetical protein
MASAAWPGFDRDPKSGRGASEIIDVEIRQGGSRELPTWMADKAACSYMSLGSPQVSASALIELRALLPSGSTSPSDSEESDEER